MSNAQQIPVLGAVGGRRPLHELIRAGEEAVLDFHTNPALLHNINKTARLIREHIAIFFNIK